MAFWIFRQSRPPHSLDYKIQPFYPPDMLLLLLVRRKSRLQTRRSNQADISDSQTPYLRYGFQLKQLLTAAINSFWIMDGKPRVLITNVALLFPKFTSSEKKSNHSTYAGYQTLKIDINTGTTRLSLLSLLYSLPHVCFHCHPGILS